VNPNARTVLVTGFEPFGGDAVNPSLELAKAVDGSAAGDCAIRGIVLPVEHRAAREAMGAALGDPALVAVLHLGLAGGRARLALEQVAVNAMDYAIADNAGVRIAGEPCVPGGPAAYFATLPLRAMDEALRAEGIPAYVSYTAGTFLCNQTLYWTLHEIARRALPMRAGFLHVPWLPAMVAAHGREEPSMDLALMRRGVEIALRIAAAA
jgi:pyroglutamyl-peptidase